MRYVIVGNSAAGIFAAEAIRQLDQAGQIDIISDESHPAYARCLTSYYLSGEMADEHMYIRSADFYTRLRIDLHTGERVVKVNTGQRLLLTDSGKTYNYDKLLLATGASPVTPSLPGIQSQGVFGLRTLDDAKNILSYSGPGKNAVVIGGGFVSLKAAYALLKGGLSVTCIISSQQILSQMLDQDAADMVADVLSSNGLTIRYCTDVAEILSGRKETGENVVCGVRLTTGEEIPADIVIVGKGVTPNIGFLQESGINTDLGIRVNSFMQTNVSDIFAAGDVAQGYDISTGLMKINAIWPNAAEQGTVAGRNMAGVPTCYSGSIGMNSVDFFGLSTIAAGLAKIEGKRYEVVKISRGSKLYCRLVFEGDILVGYILVGDTAKAGILTALIKDKTPLGIGKEELKRGYFRQKLLI